MISNMMIIFDIVYKSITVKDNLENPATNNTTKEIRLK